MSSASVVHVDSHQFMLSSHRSAGHFIGFHLRTLPLLICKEINACRSRYLGGWGDLGMIPSLEPIISVWLATAIHVWAQQSRLLVVHSSLTSLLFQGSPQQKGIVTYSLSSNRQRPLAGILNAAVFNTWRRFRGQVLYFAPPLVLAYLVMDWATQRSVASIEIVSWEQKLSYSAL